MFETNRHVAVSQPLPTRVSNLLWEVGLGISTRGVLDVEHPDSYHYAAVPYRTVRKILKRLALTRADVFIDVGCGKGRVLCSAARYPVREVVGLDLSTELCDQARVNAQRMRGRRAHIAVHDSDALEFDYSAGTVFTFFNPFGPATLDSVLAKIREQVGSRVIRIAYANPMHQETFARHDWLEQHGSIDSGNRRAQHSALFYRSVRP